MRNRVLLLIIGLILSCFFACTNNNISSGTGVGNPVIASVSIIADQGNDTKSQQEAMQLKQKRLPRQIIITDLGGLIFTVDSMTVHAEKIHFVKNNIDLSRTNSDSIYNVSIVSPIYSNDIILQGPYFFNAMSGRSQPPIDTFNLPEGKYSGIKVHINNAETAHNPDGSAIEMAGTFVYNENKYQFNFKFKNNGTTYYKYKGPAFNVSEGDSTLFTLVLNAQQWLSKVNLKQALDDSTISIDQNNNLIIDSTTNANPYKILKNSVIKSGYLVITLLN